LLQLAAVRGTVLQVMDAVGDRARGASEKYPGWFRKCPSGRDLGQL